VPVTDENRALRDACLEIERTCVLSENQRQLLTSVFQKRFQQALALAEGEKVRRYRFTPSGRTVWVVTGREREYQVLPDSLFCTCDDYYYRVMDQKRQLCYHIIAQQISEAMGRYNVTDMIDSRYPEVISKLTSAASRR